MAAGSGEGATRGAGGGRGGGRAGLHSRDGRGVGVWAAGRAGWARPHPSRACQWLRRTFPRAGAGPAPPLTPPALSSAAVSSTAGADRGLSPPQGGGERVRVRASEGAAPASARALRGPTAPEGMESRPRGPSLARDPTLAGPR